MKIENDLAVLPSHDIHYNLSSGESLEIRIRLLGHALQYVYSYSQDVPDLIDIIVFN